MSGTSHFPYFPPQSGVKMRTARRLGFNPLIGANEQKLSRLENQPVGFISWEASPSLCAAPWPRAGARGSPRPKSRRVGAGPPLFLCFSVNLTSPATLAPDEIPSPTGFWTVKILPGTQCEGVSRCDPCCQCSTSGMTWLFFTQEQQWEWELCIAVGKCVFFMSCSHTENHKIQKQTLGCWLPLRIILPTQSLWAQEKGKSFKARKVHLPGRHLGSANTLLQPMRQMMDLLPLVLWAMKGEKRLDD